ncbi:MAG TPA: PQQ-binding-like beta-propeller repeat protein, partial [Caldilineae bacterium]|nr:PQQ-binding-like beta-propeller repeat protein [Caldilineae bacterium]
MKRLLTILTSLLIISVGLLACEEAPTPPPSPRPTIPMATRPAPTPSPTPTSPPTPTPSATARPRAIDAGWPSAAGGPDRARFNPVAHPGQALPLWRLSFQPWGEQAVHPVEVAASPEAVFTIDSVGRVLRVNVQDGGAEAQALLWPYGPRGTVPGAALALTEEVLLVSATDTYFSPQAHLPYFRGKLVAFNAQDLTRLWELPGLFGHNYQIIAQHGQVAVTTDEDTIAMYQARTGQVVWYRQEAYRSRHLLAATGDTLFLRETTTAPPEQRGPYERRQAFVALDWVTGQVRWETRPSLTDDVVGALTDGERLYLLAPPDHLIALDIADGQELWRLDAGPTHERSPIAAAYGKLYGVRLPDQALVAYEAATGRELWRTPLPGTWSTPALAVADGYVYLCEEGEGGPRLIIVDAETGQLVSREEAVRARVGLATPYPGLAIAADRLILAGRDLRAFGQQGEPVSLPPMPSPEFAQPLLPSDEVLYESTELGNGEIWARAADGSQPPRNLTHHGADDWDPAGSPDGTRVAFESYRSGTSNVWVIDRDGEEAIAITRTDRHDIYNLHPTWSPNGEFIAFASTQTGEFQIWVARA